MSEPIINFRPILDCWDDPNKWFPCFMMLRRGQRRKAATLLGHIPPGTTCRRDDKTRPHNARQRETYNARVSDRYWEVLRMRRNGGLSELDLREGEMRLSHAIMELMKLTACASHYAKLSNPDENNDFGKQWVAELTKMILAREPTDEVPKFDPKAFGAGRLEGHSTGVKRKHDSFSGLHIFSLGSSGPDEPKQAVAKSKRIRSSSPSDAVDMPEQSPLIPSCFGSDQTGFGNPTQQRQQQEHLLDDQAFWNPSIPFPQYGSALDTSSPEFASTHHPSISESSTISTNSQASFSSNTSLNSDSNINLLDNQAFWDLSNTFPQHGLALDTSSPEFASTHNPSISESSTNSTNSQASFSSNTSLDSDTSINNPQHLPVDEAIDYGMFLVCNTCARDLSQPHKPFCTAMQRHICQETHGHEYSICCTGTGREYIPIREFCAGGACMMNSACDVDECWAYPCWDVGHKRWESWRHDSGCWASGFSQGGADLLSGGGMEEEGDWQKDLEEILGIESQDDEKTSNSAPPHLVFDGDGELPAGEVGLEEEGDLQKALEEFLSSDG
ncbi:hypothetical protein AC578_742 [Pseudocercospora eumusae]|uniref:Uncharacterized protein n=1 Tax=Pseudocercospora eumusae TaxID=321146 RepID=A0A139HMT7_9PEZI|nr:hypothetical protein AC578_742 [Pseudocercospora eumusae]